MKKYCSSHTFRYSRVELQYIPVCIISFNYSEEEKAITLNETRCSIKIGMEVESDVLIRCRNYINDDKRVSMFRLYFHTSFVIGNELAFPKVIRFIKQHEIDGAHNNDNYAEDFYVMLKFSNIQKPKPESKINDAFWDTVCETCKRKREKNSGLEASEHLFVIDDIKEDQKSSPNKSEELNLDSKDVHKENDEEEIDELLKRIEDEVNSKQII